MNRFHQGRNLQPFRRVGLLFPRWGWNVTHLPHRGYVCWGFLSFFRRGVMSPCLVQKISHSPVWMGTKYEWMPSPAILSKSMLSPFEGVEWTCPLSIEQQAVFMCVRVVVFLRPLRRHRFPELFPIVKIRSGWLGEQDGRYESRVPVNDFTEFFPVERFRFFSFVILPPSEFVAVWLRGVSSSELLSISNPRSFKLIQQVLFSTVGRPSCSFFAS